VGYDSTAVDIFASVQQSMIYADSASHYFAQISNPCFRPALSVEEDHSNPLNLSVFPNPLHRGDWLHIAYPGREMEALSVVSINGQTVFKKVERQKENTEIMLPPLSPGLYVISLTMADGTVFHEKLLLR
jgi:hypothetical protein